MQRVLAQILQLLRIVGTAVKHEYVDENALIELAVGFGGAYGRRVVVAQLRMAPEITRIGVCALQEIWMAEPFVAMSQQYVVVMARHNHVDIVVPGYEALMTHGAKHRASVPPYGQIMFGAHSQQLLKHVQLDKL